MILAKIRVSGIQALPVEVRNIPKGIIGGQVAFEYTDPMWDGLTKTVVFRGSVTKDVLNAGDVVTIPAEVVEQTGLYLYVGVYGVDADNNVIIPTLWADLGRVRAAADPSGDESTDPQLPVWAQLQEQINDLKEGSVGGGVQSDWNAAEGEPGHVLNRTHWTEESAVIEVLSETSPTYDESESSFLIAETPDLEVGKEYTVNWNGVGYKCVAQDLSALEAGAVGLGDMSTFVEEIPTLTSNGEPFTVVSLSGLGTAIAPLDGTTELTISITEGGDVVHKLDNKYLDLEWLPVLNRTAVTVYDGSIEFAAVTSTVTGAVLKILDTALFGIVDGETYTVIWNGTEYECVGHAAIIDGYALHWLGNSSFGTATTSAGYADDTGEPFLFEWLFEQGYHAYGREKNTTVEVQVIGAVYEPNKLPEKFLSESVPTKEYVDSKSIFVTGATVGQTVKIAAVDENGVPTAWEPVELPSGGTSEKWRLIRTVTIPEDITTDESGVSFAEQSGGGVTFAFDTDENGEEFSLRELMIYAYAGTDHTSSAFSLCSQRNTPAYTNGSQISTALTIGNNGSYAYSFSQTAILNISKIADAQYESTSNSFGASFNGGANNNVCSSAKTLVSYQTVQDSFPNADGTIRRINCFMRNYGNYGFKAGSWFEFYGR